MTILRFLMAAGALSIAVAAPGAPPEAQDGGDTVETRYGRRLVGETYAIIGPLVADPAMRYAGNNLACTNCHLDDGTRQGALPLVTSYADYPQYTARAGRQETIEDRVNGCMTRSMNGRALPEGGAEMTAIVAYLRYLAADPGAQAHAAKTYAPLPDLDRAADPDRGARLYRSECAGCHGIDGAGALNGQPGDTEGYLHPPLWGPDSFNDGAGLAHLIDAANYIHVNMPLEATAEAPVLVTENAWDIAAFVVSQPRPHKPGLAEDYPDLLQKPVDAAFPPFVPGFGPAQHKYGPFQPIRDAIEALETARTAP